MTFEDHQSISRDEARKIKSNALAFLQSLEVAQTQHFPLRKLSEVGQSFQVQNLIQQNPTVVAAMVAAQDFVSQALDDMSTMCDYIVLHIPQVEGGHDFGVTVQMTAIKQLQAAIEALTKSMEELSTYYTARADAMDKLLLSSQTLSETTKEENDGNETKTTITKESKTSSGQQGYHRVQAVYAVDIKFYTLAKKAFRNVKSVYVANVDFLLKNQGLIEEPKGKDGGAKFSHMY